jgi:hypothetical protein
MPLRGPSPGHAKLMLLEREAVFYAATRSSRDLFKRMLVRASRLFCTPLSRQQTRDLPFVEPVSTADSQELQSLQINGEDVRLDRALRYPETCLFRALSKEPHPLTILPSGGICAGDRLLDNGFRQDYNILGYLQSRLMPGEPFSGTAVAPWPHRFLTYGDFVLQLLPEFCLVRSSMSAEEWRGVSFALPQDPGFLTEYLVLLGCSPQQVVDSTKHRLELQPGSRVYFREKDPMWYLCAPPGLIYLTRDCLLPAVPACSPQMLFVERRGGYRRALGLGPGVRDRLEQLGVRFLDPASLSVRQQMAAFASASLVIGVHGGGLANILWCRAGTPVIELFHPSYSPPCYAILARHLGLAYYCLGGVPGQLDIRSREKDVDIDWPSLVQLVSSLEDRVLC